MTFNIDVKADIAKIAKYMDNMERKQLPYALSLSLNDIAVAVQSFIIKRIPTIFNNTRRWYDPRQMTGIKVRFANKYNPISSVYTKAHFAPIQEDGGTKLPYAGTNIAIPTTNLARQNRNSAYLKSLRGDRSVFKGGSAIYRRIGQRNLRKLYTLSPQAKVKPRFNFIGSGLHIYKNKFDQIFTRNFNLALRGAR